MRRAAFGWLAALVFEGFMSRFVLQPCHLRDEKFAPIKGRGPVVFGWRELVSALAPSKEPRAKLTLRSMQPGAYVGTVKDGSEPGMIRNFVLVNQDRSSRVGWVTRKDPSFETRLVEVYRVDEVQWEAAVQEFDRPGPTPWA